MSQQKINLFGLSSLLLGYIILFVFNLDNLSSPYLAKKIASPKITENGLSKTLSPKIETMPDQTPPAWHLHFLAEAGGQHLFIINDNSDQTIARGLIEFIDKDDPDQIQPESLFLPDFNFDFRPDKGIRQIETYLSEKIELDGQLIPVKTFSQDYPCGLVLESRSRLPYQIIIEKKLPDGSSLLKQICQPRKQNHQYLNRLAIDQAEAITITFRPSQPMLLDDIFRDNISIVAMPVLS